MVFQTSASVSCLHVRYEMKPLAFSAPLYVIRRLLSVNHRLLQSTSLLSRKYPNPLIATSLKPPTQCSTQPQRSGSNEPKRVSMTTETSPSSSQSTPSLPLSLVLLNLTTVLWGTQHAVIKLALNDMNPSTLNFARFALAALVSIPAMRPLTRLAKPWKLPVVRHGVELSLYLFAGYALQSAALLTTSASRSAFLLYLNVKLVPLFARLLYGRPIRATTWASAAFALLGTTLLTYDSAPPTIGDAFSIAAAAASALFILRTEAAARAKDVTPSILNAVTLTSVSMLMGIWTGVAAFSQFGFDLPHIATRFLPSSSNAMAAVAYLAFVTTALCNYLQAIGQRGVSAERAAVVFAMDPVYGALFAWLLLGESLGTQGITGALIILFAAVLSGLADAPTKKKATTLKSDALVDGSEDKEKFKGRSRSTLNNFELQSTETLVGNDIHLRSSQSTKEAAPKHSRLPSNEQKTHRN